MKLAVKSEPTRIVSAGNVLPAALASLRALGFVVTAADDGRLLRAEGPSCTFLAEDPLALLGLVRLLELRGSDWRPTVEEIEAYLVLDEQIS